MDGRGRALSAFDEMFCQLVARGHSPEGALRDAGLHEEVAAELGGRAWARPEIRERVAELRAQALPRRVAFVTDLMDKMRFLAERALAAGEAKTAREALGMLEEIRRDLEAEVRNGGPLHPPPPLEVLMAEFASITAEFSARGLIDEAPLPIGSPANANPAVRRSDRRSKRPPKRRPPAGRGRS